MSSAILEILDKDTLKVIGYGEYHGTSDTVPPAFVINADEIYGQKPYFLSGWDIAEECIHNSLKVILVSNYGGIFYWPSEICLKCKCITGVLSPYEPDWGYFSSLPDEDGFWKEWQAEGWPKNGDPRNG